MSQLYLNNSASGPGTPVQEYENGGLDYTSGRLTVTAADGSELTSTNYMQVRTAVKGSLGQEQIINLTKPYKIDDDSHATIHDLEGWHPFRDTTDDWDQDRPYFLYVISHNTTTKAIT